jgi:hypothetical protein
MKKLLMLTMVAAALAFTAGKVAATPFSLSGFAVFNYTNYLKVSAKETNYVATTEKVTFNNAFLYSWLTMAVAHASNGLATNLPAKGYIGYDPIAYDGKYFGQFYVAAKGFYYPLSGLDTNGDHYSYAELNAFDHFLQTLGRGDDCCCCCCETNTNSFLTLSNSVYMANYTETGFGKYSAVDDASILIHYDPYRAATNDPWRITLTGTFDPSLTLKYFYPYSPSTATFTGMGHLDLTESNGTEGLLHDHGIIPAVSIKFNF